MESGKNGTVIYLLGIILRERDCSGGKNRVNTEFPLGDALYPKAKLEMKQIKLNSKNLKMQELFTDFRIS